VSESLQSKTDEELLAQYRAERSLCGARVLLEELFRRLLVPVAVCCYRYVGDYEWAADLAQEVLMQAFRALDSFRGHSKVSTWVFTIARNQCCKAIRARAEDAVHVDERTLEAMAGAGEDPYSTAEREIFAESLRGLLRDRLTPCEIRVLSLHYGEGVPLRAITKQLGLRNRSGAKAFLISAKRKLQSALRQTKNSRGLR
jgi:RNA polymerase sigma-70 factor (ECF subfamily)